MSMIANIVVLIIVILHVCILVLEMFFLGYALQAARV